MTAIDWTPLRQALRKCRAAGTMPHIWWRDDDAQDRTAALDRLVRLAEDVGVPVHLAVIPEGAAPALATVCQEAPLIPVVHGWAHADHSQGIEKKNEFLTPRDGASDEAARGLAHLQARFGSDLRLMFVPPWNRISEDMIRQLPGMGYQALSTYGPRAQALAAPDLTQINTHVDPIDWKGTRSLIASEQLVAQAASALIARAEGRTDASEPFGLLTHHLVHDGLIWTFAQEFLTEMQTAGATPWQWENTL